MSVASNPMSMWSQLPQERRNHLRWGLAGISVSWTLAVLMACSTPGSGDVSLYQQMGGAKVIESVTDRTMDRVAADPRTKRSFDGIKMATLKKSVSAYVCKIADGPCVYEGGTMARSHADANISGAEFDIMVAVMREELDRANVSEAAKNELLKRLAPTRRDIVKH